MIQKVGVQLQNSQYVQKVGSHSNAVYFSASNIAKDSVSFKGLGSDFRTALLNPLEKIKSKIPHNVIVVSGPSGAGKDTIINAVKAADTYSKSAVSYTTRAIRPGEVDGQNYYFVSQEVFDKMDANGEIFQQLRLNGKCYGGTMAEIDSKRKGGNVIMNMSAEEAYKIKEKYGKDSVLLFIAPPNFEELEKRLIKRGTETLEAIKKRLEYGKQQMECAPSFDKVIVNDKLDVAIQDANKYIKKCRKFSVKVIDGLISFVNQIGKSDKVN